MINFAICDGEPHMAEEIAEKLCLYMKEKQSVSFHIDTFPDGSSLLNSSRDFDLIFLDIQMNEPDGMETARILRERNYRGLVVFVTVLKECVFDAFEVQPFDYLLKPLDDGHFRRTMDRAMESLKQQENNRIVIKKGCSCEVIRLSDIEYCEVQGRKIYIHQRGGRPTAMKSLIPSPAVWTAAFSDAIEVLSSIWGSSADAPTDRSPCHQAGRSPSPGCGSGICARHFCNS